MKRILCFGDSNTWGYIPENGERYPRNIRWTGIISERMKCCNVEILEEGLCGRTTVFEDLYRPGRNGALALPGILSQYTEIDGAVIMLGTNDCKSCYKASAQEIGAGIEKCLDILLQRLPADKILLLSPIYLGENVWKEEYDPEFDQHSVKVSKELKRVYEHIASGKHIRFIAASDYAYPSNADEEHFTPEGHAAIANAVWEELCKLLSDDIGLSA